MINENEDGRLSTHLDKLGDLLDKGWCKGVYARSKSGDKIDELSQRAVCFCISGGINKVAASRGKDFRQRMCDALSKTLTLELMDGLPNSIAQKMPPVSIIKWNDKNDRTQQQVVKLCRDTAQRLRTAA